MAANQNHPRDSRRLLSEFQVADELGVSTQTLGEWREADTGPRWEQVQGQLAYRPADVAAWLAKAARRPAASRRADSGLK